MLWAWEDFDEELYAHEYHSRWEIQYLESTITKSAWQEEMSCQTSCETLVVYRVHTKDSAVMTSALDCGELWHRPYNYLTMS